MSDRPALLAQEPGDEVERIVEQTKHAIILGRLRPRERLIEDDLCAQFDTSRHVIRAAFVQLDHLGLVVKRRNKGVVVRDFEPAEIEEICDMRALLEGEAARRVPLPAPARLLEELRAIHARYGEALAADDLELICNLDDAFHKTFFEAADNHYLTEMIRRLWTETLGVQSYAIRDPAMRAAAHDEAARIIDALASGDRALLEMCVVDRVWSPLNAYNRANSGLARSGI